MQNRFGKRKGLLQLRRTSRALDVAGNSDDELEELRGYSEHADVGPKRCNRKRQKPQNPFYYDGGASDCDMDDVASPTCPSVRSLFGKPYAGRSEDDKWHAAHDRIVQAHYCSVEAQDREALVGPVARVRNWLSFSEAVSDNNVELARVCSACTTFEQTVRVIFLEGVVDVHFKWVTCSRCVSPQTVLCFVLMIVHMQQCMQHAHVPSPSVHQASRMLLRLCIFGLGSGWQILW